MCHETNNSHAILDLLDRAERLDYEMSQILKNEPSCVLREILRYSHETDSYWTKWRDEKIKHELGARKNKEALARVILEFMDSLPHNLSDDDIQDVARHLGKYSF